MKAKSKITVVQDASLMDEIRQRIKDAKRKDYPNIFELLERIKMSKDFSVKSMDTFEDSIDGVPAEELIGYAKAEILATMHRIRELSQWEF